MRIKQVFEASGKTKKYVYDQVGITKVAFDNILKEASSPKGETIEKIAEALDVPCGALFDDWQEPEPPKEFYAFIRVNGRTITADSLDELKAIITNIKVD